MGVGIAEAQQPLWNPGHPWQSVLEGTGKRWCGAVTHPKAGESLSVSGAQHLGRGTEVTVLGQRGGQGKQVTGERTTEGDGQTGG